jgi:hypothetical protein
MDVHGMAETAAAIMLTTASEESAKGLTAAAQDAAKALVRRIRAALAKDSEGMRALERVADPPVHERHLQALAESIEATAERDPAFREELAALLERATEAGVVTTHTTQTAVGSANVQIADVDASTITIGIAADDARP